MEIYLTKELYIKCFFGGQDYLNNEDKFLIGYINKSGNKLKDVITGQVVEASHFMNLSCLKWLNNDDGMGMALGFMTGLRATDASIRQRVLAGKINLILSNEFIAENQISKIKNIMNKEIIKCYNKDTKRKKFLDKKNEELQQYTIDESERDF